MAVIRDNRGALLASNISQYIAGAANTAGTPIDTNQLVSIINQFLGTGEQIRTVPAAGGSVSIHHKPTSDQDGSQGRRAPATVASSREYG